VGWRGGELTAALALLWLGTPVRATEESQTRPAAPPPTQAEPSLEPADLELLRDLELFQDLELLRSWDPEEDLPIPAEKRP
jgi:hypothetical protein